MFSVTFKKLSLLAGSCSQTHVDCSQPFRTTLNNARGVELKQIRIVAVIDAGQSESVRTPIKFQAPPALPSWCASRRFRWAMVPPSPLAPVRPRARFLSPSMTRGKNLETDCIGSQVIDPSFLLFSGKDHRTVAAHAVSREIVL
jgi:hypothetical protein